MAVPDSQNPEIEAFCTLESLAQILRMEKEGVHRIGVHVAAGIPGANLAVLAKDEAAGFLLLRLTGATQDPCPDPRRNRQRAQDLKLEGGLAHLRLSAQL